MPTTTQRIHPSGITIFFDSGAHTYTDSLGRSYDSVSRIIHDTFPPFDYAANAARVAAREGTTTATVLSQWSAKAAAACRFGTRVHAVAEASIQNLNPRDALSALPADCAGSEPANDRERAAFAAAWTVGQQIRAGSRSVHPETLLADPESLTAGTTDLIAIRRDGSIILLDYKTNERIDTESRYNSRALAPFEHLSDCHLVKYSLQLHLYRWMLLRAGYFSQDTAIATFIVHFASGSTEPAWMPTIDLSREADRIMQGRRSALSRTLELLARDRQRRADEAEMYPDSMQEEEA